MEKKSTKEKILEATLLLISDKGYLGATTREIASQAGLSEITLFRHFGSKENLFEAVLNQYTFLPHIKEMRPDLETLPYPDALFLVGTRFLWNLKEGKSLVKIIVSECKLYPEKIKRVYNRVVEELVNTLADYIASLQDAGEVRKFPPVDLARIYLRSIYSYFLIEEIIRGENLGSADIEKYVRQMVDVFVGGTLPTGK